jgi:hypothetical protein
MPTAKSPSFVNTAPRLISDVVTVKIDVRGIDFPPPMKIPARLQKTITSSIQRPPGGLRDSRR